MDLFQLIPGSGSATLLTGLNRNPSGQTTFGFDRKLKRSKIPGSQRQQHRHLEEQEIEHKVKITIKTVHLKPLLCLNHV